IAAMVGIAGAWWPRIFGAAGIDVSRRTYGLLTVIVISLAMLATSWLCLRAAAVHTARARWAWAVIGAALTTTALGLVFAADTAGTLRLTEEALHPLDDIVGLAGTALLGVGLALVPSSQRRRSSLRSLNTALVVVATLTLIWAFFGEEAITDGRNSARFNVVVAGLLVDTAVGCVAAALTTRSRLGRRPELRALLVGSVIVVAADLIEVLVAIGVGAAWAESIARGATSAGLVLIAFGAHRAWRGTTDGDEVAASTARTQQFVPALAMVAALAGVVIHATTERTLDTVTLLLGTTSVALVLARLHLLERQQRSLTTELVHVAERMATEARSDALTGLGNRSGLNEHLSAALERRDPSGISLFYIDVDHFKSVNDGLGHEGGDQLLLEIGDRLSSVLGHDVFRIGGDEFVAVREDLNRSEAEAVATALVAAMEQPVHVAGRRLRAAVSVGLARSEVRRAPDGDAQDGWPARRPDSAEALLRRADLALYRAKELGRARWAAYDPWLQQRADRRHQMQQGLHRALHNGEIDVYFQPVVRLPSGRVVGADAVVRWHSPEHGLVLPDDFLPVAADAGLLTDIGQLVIRRAEATLAELNAPLALSVTLSLSELSHPAVIERLRQAAQRTERDRFWIRVREDAVIDPQVSRHLSALRNDGIRVVVEGFGAGPSSLRHLSEYPADAIAVDRSFVDRLGEDDGVSAIVEAVARLADDLDLQLVSEGVSSDRQAEALSDLGYEYATGWHFGRPVPIGEFRAQYLHAATSHR
ncbi:MAG: putative bifunctional diguanylate cyclase/phosphodiesterase, partial [Actinomycetes bacterium]